MSHSMIRIWIHAVWATKERALLIQSQYEHRVYQFIADQFEARGCSVKIINGMPDHIHCLFLLNPQKSISEVVKQVKGSSSHFINVNGIIPEKFARQTGFAAFSVSDSGVQQVFSYIQNQKQHHLKKCLQAGSE